MNAVLTMFKQPNIVDLWERSTQEEGAAAPEDDDDDKDDDE